MTLALESKLGGSPFDPAGNGKSESVKAMGRNVVVYNCDSSFNHYAMERIFIGLCQMGAWACFDEFNRLYECTLLFRNKCEKIQNALKSHESTSKCVIVDLLGRKIELFSWHRDFPKQILACKLIAFFSICEHLFSKQIFKDFGLRALKSVLVSSGNMRRHSVEDKETDGTIVTEKHI
ncbi:hypothetical protein B566_EDAN017859 [Ephemera danica]|nr:hypothetical protein B566_EDAN017859 [Ephemera danica]